MNVIQLVKAAAALIAKLEGGASPADVYATLEKRLGADEAAKVWKKATGRNPPAKTKAAPVTPKVENKPAAKPVAKPVTKPATTVTDTAPVVTKPAATATTTTPAGTTPPAADDFAAIKKFRNSADCSKWPVTVTISDVSFRGKNIAWKEAAGQREARKWNVKTGKKSVNGECIFLIPSIQTAGMFDYLGVGQTLKTTGNIFPGDGGSGFFSPWVPTKGERVGFCIATISRDKNAAKMQERSNVVWFTWP